MRIHGKLALSIDTNGPGRRAVIWTQGCKLACPGCWNQETHALDGGVFESVDSLADWVLHSCPDIDGVTFSGGEPMHQAVVLLALMRKVKREWPEASFGMFTGYTPRELESGLFFLSSEEQDACPAAAKAVFLWYDIKRLLDFAVMGRYNQQQPDTRPMCSSKNQELVLFSDRYTLSDFKPQRVEMVIHESGDLVSVTGFPTSGAPL